ncbi:CRISPR-associated helicase Cas3' [Pigmentiphaga aceris]|uniref:CRISPR-associated helicase Cas3 n=1 Tax=Pigmentiphaga aceris TaxID=1940612 RepID=A0A5C0B4E1_9BURK|nr:CRISPR-associated helicase Cas3' [Pigmentiphaga aceris]QEI07671.1 CRISPR-associated helicase Cas3' [Pigmentiphaga aceris]
MTAPPRPSYYAYWGKAMPVSQSDSSRYHLLAYHSLEVAAAGSRIVDLPAFSLHDFAQDLGWPLKTVAALHRFFLAIHDLGKFARAFQRLVPGMSADLVPVVASKRYDERHDTLGWLLWRDYLAQDFDGQPLPNPDDYFWADWARICTGHHGVPPKETSTSGAWALDPDDFFCTADIDAARAFYVEAARLLIRTDIPTPDEASLVVLKKHAWRLAGTAVLADWLGSDQRAFAYQSQPVALDEYWDRTALPVAKKVVQAAGVGAEPIRDWSSPFKLFDYLASPTPLQQLAATMPLGSGPQLFLLEDVTGAGKTEAALMLAYRLMSANLAHGLYFGLPTMATANQMYQRVGSVYRRLYEDDASPSLVLAHGARQLVDAFRESVLYAHAQSGDADYRHDDTSASSQCAAWLADSRKKSLLAHVGVGTLDQALLSVLPVRHQSLRLLGLASKVLLVDEVHAYDPYMRALLAKLLAAHASQGGSAILLSATLANDMRAELVQAFQAGKGNQGEPLAADLRYPLVTHVHDTTQTYACETRSSLVRQVAVRCLHDEDAVITLIREQAAAGKSVCWIRNTVGDARAAYAKLSSDMHASTLTLFHSRYAMGDRLDIEDSVLARFGKTSTAAMRRSQVLVATQVVEQSLDLDFDVLISDLAPIDLLIQRAGRLHRHTRAADGEPSAHEQRPEPVLHILAPVWTTTPRQDWYSLTFPRGRYVYPNVGNLWLTQRALVNAGRIVSPGEPGQIGGVRTLVEAVYGDAAEEIPDALQKATSAYMGVVMAEGAQARFNALRMENGYCVESSHHWYEDTQVPTRLGEATVKIFLCRDTGSELQAWRNDGAFAWEQSAVTVDARHIEALSPAWSQRFGTQIDALRARHRLLEAPALLLPLVAADGRWQAETVRADGKVVWAVYDAVIGLVFEAVGKG